MAASETRIDQPAVLRDVRGGAGVHCAKILRLLPRWFGLPEANQNYIAMADAYPGVLATVDDDVVGITTVKHHSQYAAEIYLMAVKPAYHRHGIGRLMLHRVERNLAADGVEFLQVKTLSAGRVDKGYAKTRAFWLASGFRPLEEFPTLWDPSNPALQLIKTVVPTGD